MGWFTSYTSAPEIVDDEQKFREYYFWIGGAEETPPHKYRDVTVVKKRKIAMTAAAATAGLAALHNPGAGRFVTKQRMNAAGAYALHIHERIEGPWV